LVLDDCGWNSILADSRFAAHNKTTRNAAVIALNRPEFEAAKKRFDAAVQEDNAERRAAAANSTVLDVKKGYTMMLAPLAQLPIILGVFFGIKKMCEFPVEQTRSS
jgi:YidC/Oxa1 family membrane protein insertase